MGTLRPEDGPDFSPEPLFDFLQRHAVIHVTEVEHVERLLSRETRVSCRIHGNLPRIVRGVRVVYCLFCRLPERVCGLHDRVGHRYPG